VYLSNAPSVRVESFSLVDAAGIRLRCDSAGDAALFRNFVRIVPSFRQAVRLHRVARRLSGNARLLTTGNPRLREDQRYELNEDGRSAPIAVDVREAARGHRLFPLTEVIRYAE